MRETRESARTSSHTHECWFVGGRRGDETTVYLQHKAAVDDENGIENEARGRKGKVCVTAYHLAGSLGKPGAPGARKQFWHIITLLGIVI
jgi:hypothetical protein